MSLQFLFSSQFWCLDLGSHHSELQIAEQIEQMQLDFDLETDTYITVGQVKSQVGLFQIIW